MSTGLSGIIATIESLADYQGPWRVLRGETALLQTRLAELRERERRLDDVLLVALVGGSGVGKSTLLNALAGDQIAQTSEMRPCTSTPTVYHPPGMRFNLEHLSGVRHVARSALENIALIDTPDSDTIVKEHRRIVEQVLQECDLILLCADGEKYLDEATWSLLQPLRGLRAMVCVETRAARADDAIREHWMKRLREYGFQIEHYFRVNALRALDRKLAAAPTRENEFDFAALEGFLRHELDRERVARIKSSNAAGLLTRTVDRLRERLEEERGRIDSLQTAVAEGDVALAKAAMNHFTAGVLAESHLWVQALGRETGMRAKGFIGALFKIVEAIRSLPYRLPLWLSFDLGRRESEISARALFAGPADGNATEKELPEALLGRYAALQSEMRARFIRAGFDMSEEASSFDFYQELNRRIGAVFGGAVHERLTTRAKWLTAWPVAVVLDGMPLAFAAYTGYLVVRAYWQGSLLPTTSFLHAGVVLCMLLAAELLFLSTGVRLLAWGARRKGLLALKKALVGPGLAFTHEKGLLEEVNALYRTVDDLHKAVSSG